MSCCGVEVDVPFPFELVFFLRLCVKLQVSFSRCVSITRKSYSFKWTSDKKQLGSPSLYGQTNFQRRQPKLHKFQMQHAFILSETFNSSGWRLHKDKLRYVFVDDWCMSCIGLCKVSWCFRQTRRLQSPRTVLWEVGPSSKWISNLEGATLFVLAQGCPG